MPYTEPQAEQDGRRAGADGAMRGYAGEYGLSVIQQADRAYRKGGPHALRAWVRGYLESYHLTERTLEESRNGTQPDGS